eukprot:NODE_573_length_5876_cov_0.470833.p1 type:complete len:446 gc:universal NODE_573_length_5876_cov_0.470833:2929-1592(-)
MLILTLSLVFSNLYCLICIITFISAQRSNIIRNRLPVTTLFMVIPLIILLNISQLNLGYASKDPVTEETTDYKTTCTQWVTILHLTAPTFFVYFFVRCAHVVLICKAHLAKYFISEKSNRDDTLVWSYTRVDDLLRFINTHVATFLAPKNENMDKFETYSIKSDTSRVSFKNVKNKLLDFARAQNQISFFGVVKSFLVVCIFECLLLIITISLNKDHLGDVEPCPMTNYIAIMGIASMGILVLPWFILSVQHVNENFGIKKEMMWVSFEIVFFMALYVINLSIKNTETGQSFEIVFGSDLWIILMLLSLATTCLLIPGINGLIEIYKHNITQREIKRSESEYVDMQSQFQKTIENSAMFDQFKKYLVADFAIENDLKTIYNDFIRSNATYELNLPMDLRDEFKLALEQERLELGLLNPIAREVSKMLMDNNFPRFYHDILANKKK